MPWWGYFLEGIIAGIGGFVVGRFLPNWMVVVVIAVWVLGLLLMAVPKRKTDFKEVE